MNKEINLSKAIETLKAEMTELNDAATALAEFDNETETKRAGLKLKVTQAQGKVSMLVSMLSKA
jgi:hypothetical protein